MTTKTLFAATSTNTTTALQLAPGVEWTTTIGNRAIGGIIRGRAASGKTTFIHRLVESLCTAEYNVLLADPLARRSAATGLPHTTRITDTLEAVTEALTELDTELTARINGRPSLFFGAPASQPVFIVVDHAEFVLDDRKNASAVERLALLGGPMGIGIILSGQAFCVWPSYFEAANLLTFTYPLPANTAGWGIRIEDVTDAPQHFRTTDGEVTGINLAA